jgi:hypothetical protein
MSTEIRTTYAPGYVRGGGEIRLLNPYLGETFSTLEEARKWVVEEESDKYMDIVYFAVAPVVAP